MVDKLQRAAVNNCSQFTEIAEFVLSPNLSIPETALEFASTLLIDTVGVAAGAARLEAGQIARDFAVDFQGAGQAKHAATLMFDGRKASLPGAAYAVATSVDNLDAHDGYNPSKGHIGCAAVPALFAFAEQHPRLTGRQALTSLTIAYEVAARAATSLHATVSDYHTSGAWNALGVAALGCRMQGCDPDRLRHALGIAEYHGPRSQMMREIANPTMLHDGSGMGALVGVSAAILASRGFEGAPAITAESSEVADHWRNLGNVWTIEKNYIKPYPICRWAHAAIDAVRKLAQENEFSVSDIRSVNVQTFNEAACLFPGMPQTTSQAQYSLRFSVALMLHYGRIGPEHISGDGLINKTIEMFLAKIVIEDSAHHSSRFPASRCSDVTIELNDGRELYSGHIEARGGPEAPMKISEIEEKFLDLTSLTLEPSRARSIWGMRDKLLNNDMLFSELAALVSPPATNAGV